MGVMDKVCITFFEGDVVIFPLEMFRRLLVQIVDISERPLPCFPDVAVLVLMHLPSEVRSAEDSPDLTWGLRFWSLILCSHPPIINIIM